MSPLEKFFLLKRVAGESYPAGERLRSRLRMMKNVVHDDSYRLVVATWEGMWRGTVFGVVLAMSGYNLKGYKL